MPAMILGPRTNMTRSIYPVTYLYEMFSSLVALLSFPDKLSSRSQRVKQACRNAARTSARSGLVGIEHRDVGAESCQVVGGGQTGEPSYTHVRGTAEIGERQSTPARRPRRLLNSERGRLCMLYRYRIFRCRS